MPPPDATLILELHSQQRTLDRHSSLPGVFYCLMAFPVLDPDVDTRVRASAALAYATVLGMTAAVWLLPTGLYSRWRNTLIIGFTLALASVPHTRDSTFTPTWLREGPRSGPLGRLQDVWRMLIGTRTLTALMSAFFMHLPLLYHVPVRILANILVRNPSVCRSPLMTAYSPAIAKIHEVIDLLLRPMRYSLALEHTFGPSGETDEQRCNSLVTFTHLTLGVILTTVTLHMLQPPAVRLEATMPQRKELVDRLAHLLQRTWYLLLAACYQIAVTIA